ncbi:MAG: GNAT family N-acetyltransferase [Candidatus Promineifilaceae bacterium]|nr:GNAT family N-acetyltransferase [Candidatus Promineifilaceae bacterium]
MNARRLALSPLSPDQYQAVADLFQPLRFNLLVDAVLAGNTAAQVWADDIGLPQMALLWNRLDALLLCGRPTAKRVTALRRTLEAEILPAAAARAIPELALQATEPWLAALDDLSAELGAAPAPRRYYIFDRAPSGWPARLPADAAIQPLAHALRDGRLAHHREAAGWVHSFWPDLATFAARGLGFGLVRPGLLASWCLSVYSAHHRRELGVATASNQRSRGYATLVAAACVTHCHRYHLVPEWHCWEDNRASIAVAEKVGFVRPTAYPAYRLPVPPL